MSSKVDLKSQPGLKVLIAGAGIGGLTAAIALRRQGHQVEVFERSRFANEIGAAIHLTPNANGLLKRIGVDPLQHGAVRTEQIRDFKSDGELNFTTNIAQFADTWQHEWLLIHRAHLHEALRATALDPGQGRPVILHTSSTVVSVDARAASVTLEDGRAFHGDVVLGADGVHSKARYHIAGQEVKAFSSGKNAFRFLVPRKQFLEDPETAELAEDLGSVDMWHSDDSKVVIYPCVNNQVFNFVCIHPENLSDTGISGGWDQSAGKDTLMNIYKDFEPRVRKALGKADRETLKVWPLLDMQTLPRWVNDHLALLGDAAHPFLPYRGSGGAMAIEDGISLAIMLSDAKREEIPERLKLYEKARHERVTIIQDYTRESAKRRLPMEEAMAMLSFIHDHDEWDYSTQILRKHRWAQSPRVYYRQPAVFGPMPGPRQDFWGTSRTAASTKATFRTASITFKTSRPLLRNLLPNESYSFVGKGSIAYATLSQTTLDNLDWLAGGGYNHLGLYIHGVQYKSSDGQVVEASYLPVLFEDLADPIISGREELGFPKVFSTIDVQQRQDSYHVTASWRGAVWGRVSLTGLRDEKPVENPSPKPNLFVHRYMPHVGKDAKGKPEAEYAVVVDGDADAALVPSVIKRVRIAKHGSFQIDELDWNQLPTLHHVISRLAEIPVHDVVDCKVIDGEGVVDVSSARKI
ncbi:hypothetical protein CFD26_103403 [Aspergillus turcosus]|uniref:FAD-binding domain-containing protein n=1 Tax=Aspergillus turcosus TaxID=1245748 RepID=A0A421CW59_9EURO|nr:hypothetical protein CFD26_103403 [Aspergillus turcosus]